MKKYIYPILVFLLFSCSTTNKSGNIKYKDVIKSDFTQYLNLVINQEFEKSMEYILEDFFEIIPKKTMINILENSLNNPDFKTKFDNPKIIKIKDAELIDNKYYSVISYSLLTKINFKDFEKESPEDKADFIEIMKQNFGNQNVKFNNETSTFEIYTKSNIFAVSKNEKKSWKFLVVEEKHKYLLKKIIPNKLLKDLLISENFERIRNDLIDIDLIENIEGFKTKYPNFVIEQTKLSISELKTNLEKEAGKIEINSFTEIIKNKDNHCGFIKLVDNGESLRVKYIYLKDKSENGELAKKILNEYENGKSFSSLAEQYSKDGNTKNGGDLGWVKTKSLVSDFTSPIKKHKLNDVFITKTKAFGWYVIKKTHNRKKGEFLNIIKVRTKDNCR